MSVMRACRLAAVALLALLAALATAQSAYAIDTGFRYEINPQHSFGKCITVAGTATVVLAQEECNGGTAQRYVFKAVAGGLYEIRSVRSNLCLDVSGGSLSNRAAVIQFPCNGQANQRFRLLDDRPGIGTSTRIQADHSGKCLDVEGASQDRARLIQFTCNKLPHQIYDLSGRA